MAADFFDYFRHSYVINLPIRKDRLRQVKQELASINAPEPIIFPAIRPNEKAGFPSIGARGCFLSHLAVLRHARARKLERVLIFEDDVAFSPDFAERSANVANWLRERPWGIFYGGVNGVPLEIPPHEPVLTCHFIGLDGAMLDDVVAHLEAILSRPPGHPLGGPMHVDGAYSRFRADRPDVVTLAACPPLCWQRSSASDIHTKWFDVVPLLRNIASITRGLLPRR